MGSPEYASAYWTALGEEAAAQEKALTARVVELSTDVLARYTLLGLDLTKTGPATVTHTGLVHPHTSDIGSVKHTLECEVAPESGWRRNITPRITGISDFIAVRYSTKIFAPDSYEWQKAPVRRPDQEESLGVSIDTSKDEEKIIHRNGSLSHPDDKSLDAEGVMEELAKRYDPTIGFAESHRNEAIREARLKRTLLGEIGIVLATFDGSVLHSPKVEVNFRSLPQQTRR